MSKKYVKPMIAIVPDYAEGVYAASGNKQGKLDVTYSGVWDKWNGGGKILANVNWSGIEGTITLKMKFNETILQVEAAGATSSVSGNNVTLTFPATAECPMMVGLHLNGAAKQFEEVQLDSYDYSVN